ncbi:hypothetical protein [Micromonospora sp. NBC_01638]|uniref:hypothetical protein n=1 Tax=Micromonospora sp. NBC_01638 TaxID=2975982 RepID=UPI00386C3C48|nr:hypothetical protein OG811_22490 [Micromonospora sp. NBC_01638]
MLFVAEGRQPEQSLVAVDRSDRDLTPRGKVESDDIAGGGLRAQEFASVGGSEPAGRASPARRVCAFEELAMTVRLLTVGHGTVTEEEWTGLLVDAGVRRLVDVRRWQVATSRAYAEHTCSGEFIARVDDLVVDVSEA